MKLDNNHSNPSIGESSIAKN